MFAAVADLRTRDQLPLDIPAAVGGGPETVAPGDGLRQYMAAWWNGPGRFATMR